MGASGLSVGDVVTHEDASNIIGDVVSVDESNGVVVIAWRPTTTTESLDELILVKDGRS